MQMQLFNPDPIQLNSGQATHKQDPELRVMISMSQPLTNIGLEAQRERLLARLRHGLIDTIEARRDLNILMPGARINELRKAGIPIRTERVELHDDQGRRHSNIARYSIVK